MNQILDTLAASRKLEDSGVPQAQAEATVEIMNHAMQNLVTKQYLTAELDKRFGEVKSDIDKRFSDVDRRFSEMKADMDKRFSGLEGKIDTYHARLGRSMAWGFLSLAGLMIGGGSLLIAALQFFI